MRTVVELPVGEREERRSAVRSSADRSPAGEFTVVGRTAACETAPSGGGHISAAYARRARVAQIVPSWHRRRAHRRFFASRSWITSACQRAGG